MRTQPSVSRFKRLLSVPFGKREEKRSSQEGSASNRSKVDLGIRS